MEFWRLDGWPSADEWSAWWSFATFLVAVGASIVAIMEYRGARRKHIEDGRAALLVDLEFSRGGLYLSITNTGRAVARDCSVSIRKSSDGVPFLRKQLSRLAPGAPVRINLGSGPGEPLHWKDESLEVVTQHDAMAEERVTFELADFVGLLVERDPLVQIAAAIERLARRR